MVLAACTRQAALIQSESPLPRSRSAIPTSVPCGGVSAASWRRTPADICADAGNA